MSVFWPTPFEPRVKVLTGLAAVMAIVSTFLCWSVGDSGGGAWIFCTTLGALTFIVLGREKRIFLTTIFCLTLYLSAGISFFYSLYCEQGRLSLPTAEGFIAFQIAFVLGVALPVGVAWLVSRFTSNDNAA